MRCSIMIFLCLVVVGCGTTAPSFLPGSLPEPPAMQLLPPVQTSIPVGVYLGSIEKRSVIFVNGQQYSNNLTNEAYSETVDANGLPLIQPDQVTPQVGAIVRLNQSAVTGWMQVVSIDTNGNQLVINYRFAIRRADGFQTEGTGTWTYRHESPNILHYSGHESGVGFLGDGRPTIATLDGSASLTSS